MGRWGAWGTRLVIAAMVVIASMPLAARTTSAAGANVLLHKTVIACPAGEYGGTSCANVVDGDESSRYIAAADGDWWIVVDAGEMVTVKDYRLVGPTHVGGDLCNESGSKILAGYTAPPTSVNADPNMVFLTSSASMSCWDLPTQRVYDGSLPRPFTARYFLILGHSFFYGGWNEFALYASDPLVPPDSPNVLLNRPVVGCPARAYATQFGFGSCGDANDGDEASRYTAALDGVWSLVIDAGADVTVRDYRVVGPTPIPGTCSQSNAKISGFTGPPFVLGSATQVFAYDLASRCWDGVVADGALPQSYAARYFMISGLSFFYGGWNELALFRVAADPAPVVTLHCDPEAFLHDGVTFAGSFTAADPNADWVATYDGFDQAGPAPLPLRADHTFSRTVVAPQLSARTFHVVVRVTDGHVTGEATCQIVVVPKRVVVYVHGTTGSFQQDPGAGPNDFPSLFGPLAQHYAFVMYEYYEDAGNRDDPSFDCRPGARRPLPVIDPTAGLPFSPSAIDPFPGICDSNDDVEINAALLDSDIRDLAAEFDKVILLSNSGGGRVVRTYLAYAAASGSPSLDLVDVVVNLQGVEQGTYIAAAYFQLDQAIDADPAAAAVRDELLDDVKPLLRHDPRRPLFADVTPRSDNIVYTNLTVPVPDGPHYVNVDGDIHLDLIQSFFLVPLQTDSYAIGDIVMLPGEDDPRGTPDRGGARFLPSAAGRGASSTEWELSRTITIHVDPSVPGFVVSTFELQTILDAPETHVNLGRKLDEICVRYGGTRRLSEVLFRQIAALDSGLPPAPGALGLERQGEVSCP